MIGIRSNKVFFELRFYPTKNTEVFVPATPESLTIQANNPEQEEAEETVPVQFSGDQLEIGFNVSYLLDVLSVLDGDQVQMSLSDANSSALLEAPEHSDAVYVVMPMRL